MEEPGCDICRQWGQSPSGERAGRRIDCSTSFRATAYFQAAIWECSTCGTRWLEGYYEDFTDTPIEAEWGDRRSVWRPLTDQQADEIDVARGAHSLEIDTFGT